MKKISNGSIKVLTADIDQFTYVNNFEIIGWGVTLTNEIYNMIQLETLICPYYVCSRIINLQKLQELKKCRVFNKNERYIQTGINIMSLPKLVSCNVSSFPYQFKKIIEQNKCFGFTLEYYTHDKYLDEVIYTLVRR